MRFLRDNLCSAEIFGKDVLEVGSQDVNGSPRRVVSPYGPRTYWGVDLVSGKGVDLVIDVGSLVSRFGPSSFDLVVSTEMLEHAQDWRTAVSQMKEVLRPGGILVISARGPGFPYHGFPHDYWRYTVKDFLEIFSDMKIEVCKDDLSPGVLLKAVKTEETGKADLSRVEVEKIEVPQGAGPGTPQQKDDGVDLLVANWNTLPWLRLLVSQVGRWKPKIPVRIFVWDNASTDGSREWLAQSGLRHHLSAVQRSHGDSLASLVKMTDSPYVAFMDVDAVPFQEGWLDEAVALLQDAKIGIAGISAGGIRENHPPFVHPAFCVFRRELYERLDLTPDIVHQESPKDDFDVGEMMCRMMEKAGHSICFLGETQIDLAQRPSWKNKVVHFLSSTPVLCEKRGDLPFINMVNEVVKWHRQLLSALGIWEEFEDYARDSVPRNPRCARYVDRRTVPSSEIRLSIVVPTIGRESLREMLESTVAAGTVAMDEVLVVGDGPQPVAEKICAEFSGRLSVRYLATRKTGIFGAHQRNIGLGIATGTHALFMDDDDRYKPGALRVVREALAQAPDRPHLFRMEAVGTRHPFRILWSDPEFRLGNVSSQMIAMPIVDGMLGTWPNSHCADFGFLSDTIPRYGKDRIIWREEVIAEIR